MRFFAANSIRVRIQAWYALVLIAVIGGFAGFLFIEYRTARLARLDGRLIAAVQYIDSTLRAFPPHELDPSLPAPPPRDGRPPPREDRPPPREDRPPARPGYDGDSPQGDRPPPRRDRRPPPPRGESPGLFGDLWRPPPPFPPPPPRPFRPLEQLREDLAPPDQLFTAQTQSGLYYAVWREDQSLLQASLFPATRPIEMPARDGQVFRGAMSGVAATRGVAATTDLVGPKVVVTSHGDRHEATMLGPFRSVILVGVPLAEVQAEIAAFGLRVLAASCAALVVGLVGGWWISSRIVRPITAISQSASQISADNLSERIDPAAVDAELAELARILNATFDRLQAAFDRQTRFTADASHELRTPLAVIRSHAQLALSRSRSAEDYRHTIEVCLQAALRMTNITESLLSLARADAGVPQAATEPIDLAVLVAETLELLQPLAAEKHVALTSIVTPVCTRGERPALAQVILNLVANAIQHNKPGGEAEVKLDLDPHDAAWLVLRIRDSGPGIPLADQPRLFERFFRVDKARSRASGGTGLGLAICKSIVERHGGTIGCESSPGSGATFWVRLPRHTEAITAPEASPATPRPAVTTGA